MILLLLVMPVLALEPTDISWNLNDKNFTEITFTLNGEVQTYTYKTKAMYEKTLAYEELQDVIKENITVQESVLITPTVSEENYTNFVTLSFNEDIEWLNNNLPTIVQVDSEDIEVEDSGWLLNILTKILSWISGTDDRVNILENELCKKDSSYEFCDVIISN